MFPTAAQSDMELRTSRLRALFYEALRFVGSGFISFPLGIAISWMGHEVFGWHEEYAAAVAIATLIFFNFFVSRVFVFRATKGTQSQLVRFIAVALVMRAVEYVMFLGLFRLVQLPYLLAMGGALMMSLVVKFFVYRSWVFGRA